MKRTLIAIAIIGAFIPAMAGQPAPLANNPKPNIVLYLSDDFGYGDLSCYGHPYAKTPNIDRLAKQGARFTQHYSTGETCCPSRTGIMTGIHTTRYSKYPADYGYGDRPTITSLLRNHGYVTGHFGKWHMGPDENAKNGTYGIDEVRVIGKSTNSPGRDDDLVSAAIDFIERNADRPFYVNIWGHSTHNSVTNYPELATEMGDFNFNRDDFVKTSDIQKKFNDSEALVPDLKNSMRQYLADVYGIDKNMGRVMAALDRLGIAENTILVYSSDQGPDTVLLGTEKPRKYAAHLLGYAGELTGGKHTSQEGGVRIPFIIRWPNHIKPGRIENSVTSFMDWIPTLCSIVGIKDIPDDLDGEDVSDIWIQGSRNRKTTLFWRTTTNPSHTTSLRDGNWKFFNDPTKPLLFDLSKDKAEQNNLAPQYPEIVNELSAKAKAWNETLPKEYLKAESRNSTD